MSETDISILLAIIILGSGLVTAWIGSFIVMCRHQGQNLAEFSDNVARFLFGCVLTGFGIATWYIYGS